MSPIFELKLTPPTIELTPGAERPVDRSLLLDIAPDRESLIMGTQDVVKVREALAMKISDDEYEFGYVVVRFYLYSKRPIDTEATF